MTSPRCPVCSLRLSGTFVSLNDHIGECLRQVINLTHLKKQVAKNVFFENIIYMFPRIRIHCKQDKIEYINSDSSWFFS